jgi:hypothetical protein
MTSEYSLPIQDKILTDEEVERWRCHIRAIPLPDAYVPTGGDPLAAMSDEALLNMPPHLIAHVQRTAAQGGLQVISPRQTPFSSLMVRTSTEERELGDHIVGSTASPGVEWPTLDDYDFSHLLPDQPLCPLPADVSVRTKTVTEPLTSSNRVLSDPILSCLVKGRAAIDLLRREDVNGGAEELTELLANAWGITRAEMDDMDAFTLGITGSLLRHCIKADEVFPMLHAPIQVKRSIGVGVSQVSRDVLPDDSAMDWRRMRVFCEAVFHLSTSIEGIPLTKITARPPPGDPTAAGNRRGTLCFRPAPATSWLHSPDTFCVTPVKMTDGMRGRGIPTEVYQALSRYVDVARPMTKVEAVHQRVRAKRSYATDIDVPVGETLTSGYRLMTKCLLVGTARGRTSSATVRNLIYKALEVAKLPLRMRLARYISIATSECKTHLGHKDVPDRVIDKLANKFRVLGDMIRLKVAEEATKRGHTIEEWWSDCMAQVPSKFMEFKEGTMGWTKIGLWLTFKANSDKWIALSKAVRYSALREAEVSAVGSMALPPAVGSAERIEAVGRATVKRVTETYSNYYLGVADVCHALGDELEEDGRPRTAAMVREAGYLWTLRARSIRGSNFYAIAKEEKTKSKHHVRFEYDTIDMILAPAPYRAFEAYCKHVESADWLPTDFKQHISEFHDPVISKCFTTYRRHIMPARETVATKYLAKPWELGYDMERAWDELISDIRRNIRVFALPQKVATKVAVVSVIQEDLGIPVNVAPVKKRDYFAILAELDPDEVDWMEDKIDHIDPLMAEEICSREFTGAEELRKVMLNIVDPRNQVSKKLKETVG